MRYIFYTFSFLLVLVLALFGLLFTYTGNNIIKPYIEQGLEKKLGKNVHIEALTLKPNFIDLELYVDKNSKLIINGDFSIFSKTSQLLYEIESKNLKTNILNINGLLRVKGNITGFIDDFKVDGTGQAFNSQIKFDAIIKKKQIYSIKVDVNNLKFEDILSFLKKPIYTHGLFDVHIDVISIGKDLFKGIGDINIRYGTLDKKLLADDFGLKLGKRVTYTGNINSKINGNKILILSNIYSNLAKLQTTNSSFDLKDKSFFSDYTLSIPQLSIFEETLSMPLNGALKLKGNIKKDNEDLAVDIKSNSLGGNVNAILFNNNLKISGNDVNLQKLLAMFKQQDFTKGQLTFSADIANIKEQRGNISLHVKNGKLNNQTINNTLQLDITQPVLYTYNLIGIVRDENFDFNSSFNSNILTLNTPKSNYDIKTKQLDSKFDLHVKNLKDFSFITKQELNANLDVNGTYNVLDEKVSLVAESDFLNSNTSINLADNLLHVKSNNLSFAKVSKMLVYPKVFDSFASLDATYDVVEKKGFFSIDALNGKLFESELTQLVLATSGFDLTSEVYKDSVLKGVLQGEKLDISLQMNGAESSFSIPQGSIDLSNHEINSEYAIKIKQKDFKGSIKGSLEKPRVTLNNSAYLKKKIDDVIDKKVPEKWKEPLKGLLNLFG